MRSMPALCRAADRKVLFAIQRHCRCHAGDRIFPYVTALGNGGAIWLAAGGGLCCFEPTRKTGINVFQALFFSIVLIFLLKRIFFQIPPLRCLSGRFPSDPTTAGLLLSLRTRFVLVCGGGGSRLCRTDDRDPCFFHCSGHCLLPALPLRPLPRRRTGRQPSGYPDGYPGDPSVNQKNTPDAPFLAGAEGVFLSLI